MARIKRNKDGIWEECCTEGEIDSIKERLKMAEDTISALLAYLEVTIEVVPASNRHLILKSIKLPKKV
jgi:hypothetical protein